MKTNFYGMFVALCAVVMLTSCEKDDDIRVSDVPATVMAAFQTQFPNVSYAEWEKKGGYYVADFWQEGMDTHAWIDGNAVLKMTELDLGVNVGLLPEAVQNAFKSGKYANWRVDDIDKYVRTDRTFYLIEIETPGERDRDIFFAEDGSLLKDEPDRENNDVTPDTVF